MCLKTFQSKFWMHADIKIELSDFYFFFFENWEGCDFYLVYYSYLLNFTPPNIILMCGGFYGLYFSIYNQSVLTVVGDFN